MHAAGQENVFKTVGARRYRFVQPIPALRGFAIFVVFVSNSIIGNILSQYISLFLNKITFIFDYYLFVFIFSLLKSYGNRS